MRFIAMRVVARGGIEPPTRGFAVRKAVEQFVLRVTNVRTICADLQEALPTADDSLAFSSAEQSARQGQQEPQGATNAPEEERPEGHSKGRDEDESERRFWVDLEGRDDEPEEGAPDDGRGALLVADVRAGPARPGSLPGFPGRHNGVRGLKVQRTLLVAHGTPPLICCSSLMLLLLRFLDATAPSSRAPARDLASESCVNWEHRPANDAAFAAPRGRAVGRDSHPASNECLDRAPGERGLEHGSAGLRLPLRNEHLAEHSRSCTRVVLTTYPLKFFVHQA